jgi:hypothetical protein
MDATLTFLLKVKTSTSAPIHQHHIHSKTKRRPLTSLSVIDSSMCASNPSCPVPSLCWWPPSLSWGNRTAIPHRAEESDGHFYSYPCGTCFRENSRLVECAWRDCVRQGLGTNANEGSRSLESARHSSPIIMDIMTFGRGVDILSSTRTAFCGRNAFSPFVSSMSHRKSNPRVLAFCQNSSCPIRVPPKHFPVPYPDQGPLIGSTPRGSFVPCEGHALLHKGDQPQHIPLNKIHAAYSRPAKKLAKALFDGRCSRNSKTTWYSSDK